MNKTPVMLIIAGACALFLFGAYVPGPEETQAMGKSVANTLEPQPGLVPEPARPRQSGFEVEVLVHGRPLDEYAARGRFYVEALEGAEYELRIRNPLGERVAVALSVDG